LYGLLPFTWLIPPPWIEAVNQAFVQSGVATGTESYWLSSGSLLIPIVWLVGLWQLARRRSGEEVPAGQVSAITTIAVLGTQGQAVGLEQLPLLPGPAQDRAIYGMEIQ
jgi:hypothetical protein